MKLHTHSFVKGMPMFTGVQPLFGYADSVVRFRIEQSDLDTMTDIISKFNIEDFSDDVINEFLVPDLSGEEGSEGKCILDLDESQFALVIALFEYEDSLVSMGLIRAYALRLNTTLSSSGFEKILNILQRKGILIAQNVHGVIKYKLQKQVLDSMYVREA